MSIQRQLSFWVVGFGLILVLLFWLQEVLFPFLVGMVIAYCADPAADQLEARKFSRFWASLTVTILAIFVLAMVFILILPLAWEQMLQLVERLPEYIALIRTELAPVITQIAERFESAGISTTQSPIPLPDILDQGREVFAGLLQRVFQSGQVLISILSLVVITPVIAFYFLLDWDRMMSTLKRWLPRQHEDTIVSLFQEMDKAVAGFFRGQLIVGTILGTFYTIALSLIGLKFALLIGILSGVLNFIPYVGSLTGLTISLIVAVGQFWPQYELIALVFGVFLFGQAIEGNILQPKLVGESVGLHPVWLMLSLVVFGYLMGFAGLIVAVPLAASLGVLVRFGLKQYLHSTIYLGPNAEDPNIADKVDPETRSDIIGLGESKAE